MAYQMISAEAGRQTFQDEAAEIRGYPFHLTRHRGMGSYATIAPVRLPGESDDDYRARDDETITLEEYDAPDRRDAIDRMDDAAWCAWAEDEARAIASADDVS